MNNQGLHTSIANSKRWIHQACSLGLQTLAVKCLGGWGAAKGFLKTAKERIAKIPVAKRWKARKYALWLCLAALVWLAWTPKLGKWTHWWSFSPNFGYTLALSFLLWVVILLALPFGVKWLDGRLKQVKNLFHEQATAFLAASIIPGTVYLVAVWTGMAILGQIRNLENGKHVWAVGFLGFASLSLTATAVRLMALQQANRLADSLQVLANGMREAAKMDFDHPIATFQRDEIGIISEIYNFMSDRLKSRVNFLQALYKNILIFSGLLSVDKILDHIPESFRSLEEAEEIIVALLDEQDGKLEVVRSSNKRAKVAGLRFGPGEGVFGRLLKEPQFLACGGPEYQQIAKECETEAFLWGKNGFVVAIPILFKGRIKGAIGLYGMYIVDSHLDLKLDQMQGLANQIGVFLENARLYGQVTHDRLTGFYTHGFLEAELLGAMSKAKTEPSNFTYLMIDLDKFKHVNDRYGHAAGNQLLIGVTQTIRSVLRAADIPARFGGDEFEILLPDTDKSEGLACAKKIHQAVERKEFNIAEGVGIRMTLSMGLAAYPEDAQTATQLQTAADNALYDAKALGRNGIVVYGDNLKRLSEKLAKNRDASPAVSKEARS